MKQQKGIAPIVILIILVSIFSTGFLLYTKYFNKNEEVVQKDEVTNTEANSAFQKLGDSKPAQRILEKNAEDLIERQNDATRMQDVENLDFALELSLKESGLILIDTRDCKDCTSDTGSNTLDGSGWIKYIVPENQRGLSKYIISLPIDPANNSKLHYSFYSDGKDYEINTYFERAENTEKKAKTDGGNDPNAYEIGTNLFLN